MRRLILIVGALTLLGVGCIPDIDFNRKLTDVNPFGTDSVSRAKRIEDTRSIRFEDGLSLVLRPTYLGVTGTVADVFGDEHGRTEARLDLSSGSALEWKRADRRETEESVANRDAHESEGREGSPPPRVFAIVTTEGRLNFVRSEEDRKMLLPAFWQEGESTVLDNGILWLTKDAHARLKQGQKVEWSLGMGSPVLDTASDILGAFDGAVEKLFGDGEDGKGSPFDLELVTEDGLFAVRIDGRVETVEVLQVKSWFATYLVLDNPDNPLILKVGVNPVAASALDAFSPLGVDTKALGYEITEIRR